MNAFQSLRCPVWCQLERQLCIPLLPPRIEMSKSALGRTQLFTCPNIYSFAMAALLDWFYFVVFNKFGSKSSDCCRSEIMFSGTYCLDEFKHLLPLQTIQPAQCCFSTVSGTQSQLTILPHGDIGFHTTSAQVIG